MKRSFWSAFILLFVLIPCSAFVNAQSNPNALVKVMPLAKHRLAATVTAFGRVQADPNNESSLTIAHDGVVSRIQVRLGERVAAGAVLLEIETAPAVHMQFLQAQAAVEYARSDLSRAERLFREQLATTDQVAAARNRVQQAEAVFQAQKKIGAGENQVIIRAPFAGIVTKLLVSQGDRVQANATVALIARGGALLIPLGVEPEDAEKIKPGMSASLTSMFESNFRIEGTVEKVHAMVNPTTRLVDVIVRAEGADTARLVIGMSVKGIITLFETETYAVPRSAVLRDGNGSYLFVIEDAKARRVTVETGTEQDGLIGVRGPLTDGELVVVTGNYELKEGMDVRVER